MEFTKEELEYLKELIDMSKKSLDECCDEHGNPTVDFISKKYAYEEYAMLYGLLTKFERELFKYSK